MCIYIKFVSCVCICMFIYICTHIHTQRQIFGLGPRRCEMLDFSASVCYLKKPPTNTPHPPTYFNGRALKVLQCLSICSLSCCWLICSHASLMLYFGCVLTNAFVDKHHLSLQKKFEKTKKVTIIYLTGSWPCLLPDFRKVNTCSAWLKGAVSVDSDNEVLLRITPRKSS